MDESLSPARIVAVIPSLIVDRLSGVLEVARVLSNLDIEVIVVANGKRLDAALGDAVGVIRPKRNLGFGAAIEAAANSVESWDWILLVNDDIEIDERRFAAAAAATQSRHDLNTLIYFDDASPIKMPAVTGVFLNLSLLRGVTKKFRFARKDVTSGEKSALMYMSFSMVAIGRAVWDTLQGFDSAFQFTFEDADFVRRAADVGATFERVSDVGVHHAHSQTSRLLIDTVLPVSAWGAYVYLRKWESSQATAKIVCVVALALRTFMVPFVSAPKRQHLRGIRRAIWYILRGSPPPLPSYEDM